MIIREAEAHLKTCPFMTYCINPHAAYEANFPVIEQSFCIGSHCMAWEYTLKSTTEGYCGRVRR